MGRKVFTYLAVLVGLEIVVYKATNAGTLLTKGGTQAIGLVKAVEGR